MTGPIEPQQQGVQSVEVGAEVLRALAEAKGPASVSAIARASGLHPAKVHRYLVSLVRTRLATQDAQTGRYDLGPAARRLGVEALRRTDAESIAAAHAQRLRDHTGHTANIAVWSRSGPVIVRWDSGTHEMPLTIRVGSVVPLLDSALGLVMLAHLPQAETAQVLAHQQERKETRILPPDDLELLLEDVRRNGVALAPSSLIYGFAAYASPVFDADGRFAMAVGLVLPLRQLMDDTTPLQDALRSEARAVSEELGHELATVSDRSEHR